MKASLPSELVIPALATFLFGFAAMAAFLGWRQPDADHERVTYWDAAGALTLCGLVVAAAIEPERISYFFRQSNE